MRPATPLLGEVFRAAFEHPSHGTTSSSRVWMVSEQVGNKQQQQLQQQFLTELVVQVTPARSVMHASNRICGWFVEVDMAQEHQFLGALSA